MYSFYVYLATACYSYSLDSDAMWINFGSFWVTGADRNGSLGHLMVDPVAVLVKIYYK